MHELSVATSEDRLTNALPHLPIKSLHVRKAERKQSVPDLPPRTTIPYIIIDQILGLT